MPAHEPRKRGFTRIIEPLLTSVPSLMGALVGSLITLFGASQQNELQREDDFRKAQIARVAAISQGYDRLYKALVPMLGALDVRLPDICHDMKGAAGIEAQFIQLGSLHSGVFSGKGKGGDYEKELATIAASSSKLAPFGALLQRFYGKYVDMVSELEKAQREFRGGLDTMQGAVLFDANVYFPARIRADVPKTIAEYVAVEKGALRAAFPATACGVSPNKLEDRLGAIHFRSSRTMIQFAQSLEPELANKAFQP